MDDYGRVEEQLKNLYNAVRYKGCIGLSDAARSVDVPLVRTLLWLKQKPLESVPIQDNNTVQLVSECLQKLFPRNRIRQARQYLEWELRELSEALEKGTIPEIVGEIVDVIITIIGYADKIGQLDNLDTRIKEKVEILKNRDWVWNSITELYMRRDKLTDMELEDIKYNNRLEEERERKENV